MKINKLYRLFTLVCFALFCFCNQTIAQTKGTEVNATVIDEQGNPIMGVNVFGPNGVQAITNVNGQFQITLLGDESVVIQKRGYESELISISDLLDNVTLEKSPFLATEDDQIEMGLVSKNRRENIGAISSINTKDRLKYDNTQWVRDYINGLMLGVKGSSNVRGLGNAIFVIDGVIGRDPNVLNMEEVDQITVLRDANSVALYGSQGKNGVIIINTKRGKTNRKEMNFNVRSGLRTPIALPNYVGSLDYMELFNEARLNDGQDITFLPSDIDPYKNNPNKYQYPDVDFYSNEYVKPFVNSTSVTAEFSGGSDKSKYYVNAGWNHNESWVSINPDANAGSNRINVRGNIDFVVNDWITSSLDGIAIIGSNKSSLSNLLSAGTTFKPNSYVPLLPVNMVDTIGNPALAGQVKAARIYDGMLLGGAQQFQDNTPVANAIAGGYQNDVTRTTQFNNSINFDLDKITEGLSAKTYLSFDFYDSYKLSVENKYSVYQATWEDDKITALEAFGDVDLKDLTENVRTNGFVSRIGFYALVNYEKTIAENHSLNATFLGYYNSTNSNNVLQKDIDSHLGFQLVYDYKKKVFVDFSGTYTSSIKLPEGNRGGFSPTLGLGYILSEESFLKNSNVIDYLKLKASGGIIKSDQGIDEYYLYSETYSNGGTFNWADGQSSNRRQSLDQGENLNMGFEERIDLNIGFESYLMSSLWVEFNYFRTELDKQLAFLSNKYPSYYNTFRPYDNFNNNKYTGFEIGLNYNKTINDFSVSFGANILYSETEVIKRSESYEFDYQNRVGKETSTIFGLVDQGFYSETDFDIDTDGNYMLKDGLAVPNFGAVQPGDIKYLDQNGDNVIDNDDNVAIGQSSSPWTYGVNLNLKYKSFNLFILGTGQFGADAITSNSYYQVNGNDKYSEVVLGRWTPETESTATFPRLSSGENANNFKTSTFWMYDTSFFKINRAQLTYEFDKDVCRSVGMKEFSMNISGTNLFEIAKNRDIRQLTIGGTPQFRAFMLGLRMSF
ncbi:TonB-linked outer membrane protein, SusC/RagA family [Lutibacter agarilyticus]|uniref:TonB-linked outer membrane protein, SusC/RagA family n=1 Tax=Lutibacter agarilyticus TaxID=1109740 RepID=A0A238YLI6_9FLAO|nr:SusC/RagA family TonB-linked outer membrane protein [Lutibacter agarilyticus]SNR71279.1 TonB-linked outer membrane protein, SusC/RagA family [Lutibacter agarilyticus]